MKPKFPGQRDSSTPQRFYTEEEPPHPRLPEAPRSRAELSPPPDLVREMLERGEITPAIAARVEALLGVSANEALSYLADNRPDILEDYRDRYRNITDQRNQLRAAYKKIDYATPKVQFRLALGIWEQLRITDLAEIIAHPLDQSNDLRAYETPRLTDKKGRGIGYYRDSEIGLIVDTLGEIDAIRKFISNASPQVKGFFSNERFQRNGSSYDLPALFLRKDFWTILVQLAHDPHVSGVIGPTPAELKEQVNLVMRGWFREDLREEDGKFTIGPHDPRQDKLRAQDVAAARVMVNICNERIVEPFRRQVQKHRRAYLLALHDANEKFQQAAKDLKAEQGIGAWLSRLGATGRQRLKITQDREEAAYQARKQAIRTLEDQQRLLMNTAGGLGVARGDVADGHGAAMYYRDSLTALEYWSRLAEAEFLKLADEEIARGQLKQLK